jgi:hypothetical protein
VEVTQQALIKRINRKLEQECEKLRTARSARARLNLGDYFIVDAHTNAVVAQHVDPEDLGRELGVLAKNEKVVA